MTHKNWWQEKHPSIDCFKHSHVALPMQCDHLNSETMQMRKITLNEARNTPEGEHLFELRVKLSRDVEYKQEGEVTVIAKSAKLTDEQWEEVWNQIDIDDLVEADSSFYEAGHKEEIVDTDTFSVRCRQSKATG